MTGVSGAGVAFSAGACFSAGAGSGRDFNAGAVEVDWPSAAKASVRQATTIMSAFKEFLHGRIGIYRKS